MNKRRFLAFMAVAASFSCVMSACSLGGEKPEEQVIVEDEVTPTPEPKEEPSPTPEPWEPTYVSKDGSISVDLPDESWSNKTDANGIVSIESESGKIVIVHGDEQDMETLVLPESEDMAAALERAKDLEDDEFTILNYTNEDNNGANVIYYLVKYGNTEKSGGTAQELVKYISSGTEYYEITADMKTEDDALLAKVAACVDSMKILSETSSLKGTGSTAAVSPAAVGAESPAGDAGQTENTESTDSGSAPGSYSDEDLADNNRTRTIYSNDGSGRGFVVSNNDDGTWSDEYGNKYRFDDSDTSIVYDENDVDYYYHGEAGDVRFMYITEEG